MNPREDSGMQISLVSNSKVGPTTAPENDNFNFSAPPSSSQKNSSLKLPKISGEKVTSMSSCSPTLMRPRSGLNLNLGYH